MTLELRRFSNAFRLFAASGVVWVLGGGQALAERARSGLQVSYDFSAGAGEVVHDQAGLDGPVDLKITKPAAIRWHAGALEIAGGSQLQAARPPVRLIESIRRSGELTIEAWIQPAALDQKGPARIVTLSANGSQRNFTLGQEGNRYDIRLRTTQTGVNGIPSLALAAGSVTTNLVHLVYTRDRTGRTRVYLDGQLAKEETIKGNLTNWEHFKFALGDEFGGDRQWRGKYHLVAIYSRDLLPEEVAGNFAAGPDAPTAPALARQRQSAGSKLFSEEIAPLFAKHCLECHDSANRKGKLDLSRKEAALAGTSSGEVIIPGDAGKSYLWETVETNEMPKDRPSLSRQEKESLKRWIELGAEWTVDPIDPVIYEHGGGVAQNWVRRLTVPEYVETVRAAVGVEIGPQATALLPKDMRADGFSNTAYNLNVDLAHVNAYAELAGIIVGQLDVDAFADRFYKKRKFTDDDMNKLISAMGKWLLRGPLEEHEMNTYRGISTTVAAAGGEMKAAVGLIIEAMLQAPRFIYRMENQQGDGSLWPVGEYELASRLSYTIWGAPPDAALFKAAEAGELFEEGTLRQQIARMLKDPRARTKSLQFIAEWLNLGRLENLRPNAKSFPKWEPALAADMRDETLAFFEEIVWNQRLPLSALLNAPFTFATPRLAKHYGLEPQGEGLARYDLSQVPARGGLLTQGSTLTIGGDDASMVTRGLFIMHDLLRGIVKDPPPGLDVTPVPASPGKSNRTVALGRINNQSCGGCHAKFEPLAFALEKFDGLGAYHERDEHGNTLREDGDILFPGAAEPVAYSTSAGLMDLLAGSDRVKQTITWKLTQFALGRPLTAADAPVVEDIHRKAQAAGGTYDSLLTAIVLSDLVQMTRTESGTIAAH